jgi:pimeloyl-ACP methyl ester carboxylesterase/DNA-binding CsgD family transcriptional regulator
MTKEMTDVPTAESREGLVAAIYGAALAPLDYEKTVTLLDGLLFERADPFQQSDQGLVPLRNGELPMLAAHVDAARKVQDRIGRLQTVGDGLQAIVDSMPGPTLVLSQGEQVLKANAAALKHFGSMPGKLAACIHDTTALKTVRGFLAAAKGDAKSSQDMMAATGLARGGSHERISFVVKRLGPDLSGGAQGGLFLLSVIDLGFNDQAVSLFRAAHHLTKAETEVAVLLAGGLRLSDIVEQRNVSADTVRTQIKSIKTKTAAADIPALVRLICGFSAGLASPALARPAVPAAVDATQPIKRMVSFTLPDGRRLDYLEQGAAEGRPVLLFHNVPYGMELPAAAIRRAFDEKLRFIAPMRAGHGHSAILPDCHGDALLSQNADDHAALLDGLGIGRAVVLAHSGGSHCALRMATRHPSRVSALIAAGRAPIWRDEWMQAMPQQQRFILRLTRHMPMMLPVVAWAMIACLETSYANQFVINGCKDGAADRKAVENQETIDFIAQGSVAALRETLEGFCRECAVSMLDLTAEARACALKFHIFHGADDVIVPLMQSRAFADEVPGTRLEVIHDAGQLLFYSHWPKVMDAVVKAARSG